MLLRVFKTLWRSSKRDSSEDIDIVTEETQSFIDALNKTSFSVHYAQLNTWQEERGDSKHLHVNVDTQNSQQEHKPPQSFTPKMHSL